MTAGSKRGGARPGAGRPSLGEGETGALYVRDSTEWLELYAAAASVAGVKAAQWARDILRRAARRAIRHG